MFRALTILSTFSSFFTPLRASTIYPTFSLGGDNIDGVSSSVFNGELSNDQSGTFVVNAGDLNGDNKTDFAIGAPYASGIAGKVYVVFGSNAGFNAAVDLSTLDGNNGFVILAATSSDTIGFSLAGGGDFNGDGIKDFVVGAPNVGKIYLIYGTRAGFNATFPLATLGTKGFVFRGSLTDNIGYSVAMVDFNGDGFSDLVFGAIFAFSSKGLVGVVFGTNNTVPGNVTALNGANGFVIPGMFSNGASGFSLTAGDMNGDGLADLAFGSPLATPRSEKSNAGVVTVVFGTNKSFSASLNVSLQNGTDGFSVEGVSESDNLGSSLSMGDIDGDGINDLFMGAPGASPHGKTGAGSVFGLRGRRYFNATVDLSKLNGTDGYRVNGALVGDALGSSLSAADINGDGKSDGVFSAPGASPSVFLPKAGSAFVVFGTNTSVDPVLELPGSNDKVLRIDGGSPSLEANSFCVATADIRGDGYGLSAVIVGVNLASPGNAFKGGSTYVVYGDGRLQLTNNQLNISSGGSRNLTLSDLNVSVPHNPGYTQYTITGLQHGQFEDMAQPGVAITTFNAQRVIAGGIKFIHDGSELTADYSVSAKHTFAATTPARANVTFINQLPSVVNNNIPINQGQTILVSSTMFSGTNPDNIGIDGEIIFTPTNCSFGVFSPPSSFSQAQIFGGGVYFVTFNSINPPQCSFTMFLRGAYVGPISVGFDFRTTPVLDQNHFDICQGQTKAITASMLSASQPGANSSDPLIFSINNLQYGRFERKNVPGVEILAFSQAEVKNSSIQFVHDGSPNPPSFRFTISDDRITTSSDFAGVYFTYAPILRRNTLSLDQGQTVVLSGNMLDAVNPNLNGLSEDLRFIVSNVKGGVFVKVNTTQNITQFNQSQVSANEVAFKSDGSSIAPSYDVSVANQCSQTSSSGVNINFNSAPVVTNNQLTITDRQPVILTPAELSAGDRETAGNLIFTVSNVTGGYFDATTLPETPITVFSEQRLRQGEIRFVPDNSGSLPAYNVSVSDGVLSTEPQKALVRLQNTPPATVINTFTSDNSDTTTTTLRNSLIGFLGITVPLGIAFWLGKRYLDKRMNNTLQNLLEGDKSAIEKADDMSKKNTVFPVMKEVFAHSIQSSTGCCGYRDEKTTREYIAGIETLLAALKDKGFPVILNELSEFERSAVKKAIADEIQKRAAWNKPSPSAFFRCCSTLLSISPRPAFSAQELQTTALQIAEVILKTYKKGLTEDQIDKIRRSIYNKWNTEEDLELPRWERKRESDGTEQKFDSEQVQQLAERIVQLEEGFAALRAQKEQTATSSDGHLVEVGARRASVEKSPHSQSTVVVVPGEATRVRAVA